MSRSSLPSPDRPRGGHFRPSLEALEDRNAPGVLPGTPGLPLLDDPWGLGAQKREAAELAAAASSAGANAAARTTSPVVEFANHDVVLGESTLTRNDHGVSIHLTIPDVQAGAYTAWWVVFNPGVSPPPIVGWAAGHAVGAGGDLAFSAHLNEGDVISGHPVFPSGSLEDARAATVRMVVRYHGAVDPGRVYEQTHTFEPARAIDFAITFHRPPA
jgi:hypothetical protein